MAFNGSGVFNRIYSWASELALGNPISPEKWDREENGLADGLTAALKKDGQTTPIANLPMATYRHTGVDDAEARDDYASTAAVQDGGIVYCGTVTGGQRDLTLTAPISGAALTAGMTISFKLNGAAYAEPRITLDSLTQKSLKRPSVNIEQEYGAGNLRSGQVVIATYDGADFWGNNLQNQNSWGYDWTDAGNIASFTGEDIAYGSSLYVAVGTSGGGGVTYTSTDASSWSSRTIPSSNSVKCAAFGNSLYLIGGADNFAVGLIATSTDGTTWTKRTSNFSSNTVNGITYGNSTYVAVGAGGKISTSTNGTTWTARTSGTSSVFTDVVYGDKFAAVGGSGIVYTSTDAVTWTSRTSSITNSINAITYGNGLYVAVANGGELATSSDGITWTSRTSGFSSSNILDVAYQDGVYVAVGQTGKLATSPDGITWTQRTSQRGTDTLTGIVSTGSGFALVATDADVSTSL